MNKTKIIYWSTTGLFALFMASSGIANILMTEDWKTILTSLGYPNYILPFLGVAKLLGCMAILIPNFKKIKEWAYAGFFFDLAGALYSVLMSNGYDHGLLSFILFFGFLALSYHYNEKMNLPAEAV